MAEVPELNVIPMDSYSEEEFYSDYPCKINEVNKKDDKNHLGWELCDSDWSTCRSDPIREIKRPKKCTHAFKKAVMIVVVVEKLKGAKGLKGRCIFNDFDLLNDILVHEEISINNVESTFADKSKFRYSYSEVFMIVDNRGKCMTLQEYEGQAHLLALYLQNGNIENKANINVGFHTSAPFDHEKEPVTLGIKGRDIYLNCVAEEESKVLSFMNVTNIQQKRGDDLLPFLFYKRRNGSSYTFESAAFPGWYISTTQSDHDFVQMKPQDDQQHIREFMLQKVA